MGAEVDGGRPWNRKLLLLVPGTTIGTQGVLNESSG